MEERNGCLWIPNFSRHNGSPAKSRALGKNRAESHRKSNAKSNAVSVTEALPEKRREEYVINTPQDAPCTIAQALSAGHTTGVTESQVRQWWATRERDGWMIHRNNGTMTPVDKTNWRNDLATAKRWRDDSPKDKGKPKNFTADQVGI
jgi:hypothetical protein